MSRTYKDKPWKLDKSSWYNDKDQERIEGTWSFIQLPTTKPKKRKEKDTEYHWMTTPSWWTRVWMNRPQRRGFHLQEVAILKAEDIEDVDFVDCKRKPHIYYW